MIRSKRGLIFALFFPILALGLLAAYKKSVLSFGRELVLPISGYDPRDLLSGHYLIYRIDYGVEGLCEAASEKQTAFVCLDPKVFSYTWSESCSMFIRGSCSHGRFEAGIEKYYVPEDRAEELEKKVNSKVASIVLSITGSGQAQVKDLLIEGKSWNQK